MAKPMLVTLPLVLLLLDYWPLGRMGLPAATDMSAANGAAALLRGDCRREDPAVCCWRSFSAW